MTEKIEKTEKTEKKIQTQMLISYVPGEECRVAVVEDGKLEEFHAERAASISRVGNIYVGTVTNVEPSIQAAFIDFGVEHHGFLHVSDVHPRYFPGEDDETTERVGKKTPRRDRPPIQRCFRRGDQVEVQVLKEGVGTKGPTLTSYLSIPGRFLVMMPQMDRVGVSRKVEDEEQRRAMREILDQLELPDGFGFIVRTAGMDRTKTELKRDLAYLQRLWKDMEARKTGGNKPRLLYSESDLLVRALRDMVGPEIDEVVIDNDLALARAARFLKIVAPRSRVRLLQYQGQTPLFHAFGIEQQLALMHAREVPLPSGGRLVIDETEALVAIDVNSGKMRDSRDAETNAYRTNCEAVEEICRQLKLRDLGGIVINDLIDMRHASHRKDIETRFRDRMKRDRARSTLLPISDFGILEMTRQRMRGSHESVHFVDCPTCRGRGMVQKPDSIASDALRNLAAVLDHQNVGRVEMVVSPRVASELLSGRRKTLNKLERSSGKHVDVRVSETVPFDRVSFYAYDPSGADVEVESLPRNKPPTNMKVWELSVKGETDESWAADMASEEVPAEPELTPDEQAELAEIPAHPIEFDEDEVPAAAGAPPANNGEAAATGGRKRRRRRRGGRGRNGPDGQPLQPGQPGAIPAGSPADADLDGPDQGSADQPAGDTELAPAGAPGQPGAPGEPGQGGRRRRRRRRRGGRGRDDQGGQVQGEGQPPSQGQAVGQPQTAAPDYPIDPSGEPLRGDSWDLLPSAVQPIAERPVSAPLPASVLALQGEPVDDLAIEPGAVPALTPAPTVMDVQAAMADNAVEDAAPHAPVADGPLPPEGDQTGEPGQGGRRRRRRRRGGRGRGGQPGDQPVEGQAPQPQQQNQRQPQAPVSQRQAAPPQQPRPQSQVPPPQGAPRPAQQPPRPPQDAPRSGGGYQRRQPAAAPTPEVKPSPRPLSKPSARPRAPSPVGKPTPPPVVAPGGVPVVKPKRALYSSRRKLSPGEAAKRPQE